MKNRLSSLYRGLRNVRKIITTPPPGEAALRWPRRRLWWILGVSCLVWGIATLFSNANVLWHEWGYLIGTLSMAGACLTFNLLLWRIYHRRGDLRPVRTALVLVGILFSLLTVGRMLHITTLFTGMWSPVGSLISLVTGLLALVAVVLAFSAEQYAMQLPRLADLQAATEELVEARALLQLRENLSLEGMFISADATILEANAAAYKILQYDQSKHELIGMRAVQLLHDDDYHIAYQHLLRNDTSPYVIRALTKTGAVVYLQVVGSNFCRQNNDVVRVTSFRDVSLERHYLQQLTPLPDINDKLTQELAELRSYFMGSSHSSFLPHAAAPR
ncbi:PAS domain-containing protein [Hymenobacter glacieicola]|nr:PAS domain-containing protein [Hymenobacter glacieicola]